MIAKVWRKLPPPPVGFGKALGLPPFQAHLLYNRGIRHRTEVEPFLAPDERLLNDPTLLPDMDKAVARLRTALQSGESIGIFGDFDADGVTGTALLSRALRDLGATVVTYLPDRVDEGHGLNEQAIRLLHQRGVSLLVTVDCGATSNNEVKQGTSLGIDTIITDHHSVLPPLPEACALVNPRRSDSSYPYAHLTGVGMSFKLAEALYADIGKSRPDHLLELVALGTVADVGPMTGENRYLVKNGLERLNSTENPGIQALVASAGLKLGTLDTESLAFSLIPRLNVAGRLDHAGTSLDLLTAASREVAKPLADRLERQNRERRLLTERGVTEAREQVESLAKSEGIPPIIIVSSRDWIPGILGLIAGKLADYYYRPAVAIALEEETGRASARSIPEFDIIDALRETQDLFIRFGGHPQAAGFAAPASSLPVLERRLTALADERLRGMDLRPNIAIDCEVSPALLASGGLEFIQSLSPFGEGNPTPVFLTRNARVVGARQVGNRGNHLKMRLFHSGSEWEAIAFSQGDLMDTAQGRIDVVYTAGLDRWGGRPKFQLNVLNFRPSR